MFRQLLGLVALVAILAAINGMLWTTYPPRMAQSRVQNLDLDPPPPPYIWYRINPETDLTCLIVEAQYNQHPIAMWCERLAR